MGKKLAVIQSNYIPWKGYFDIINMVDEFILFDDAQFTKRDWRNRNVIKTRDGLQWLTIPVEVKGKFYQKINETRINDLNWGKDHWNKILHNYSRARYFNEYKEIFRELYHKIDTNMLSIVNFKFLKTICEILGIKTKLSWSSDYVLIEGKTERLISICQQAGADIYYTGPTAKDYMEEDKFKKANIEIVYYDYSGYPEYTQLFGDFEHKVSVLDLIFNVGDDSIKYMKSFTPSLSVDFY